MKSLVDTLPFDAAQSVVLAPPHRVDILGCPFDAISFEEMVSGIREAVLYDHRVQIVPGSIDTIAKARRDSDFRRLLKRCEFVVADGKPIVWLASLLGDLIRGRVSGTELVWSCAEVSHQTGCVVTLVGGRGDVSHRAADAMKHRFPNADLRAIEAPFPLGPKESETIVRQIRGMNGKILLLALGAPRQERWIKEWLEASGACVGIGIGSAFDIISGDHPRAPGWMQTAGLEWFHRMMQDPRRLGRRYLLEDTPVLGWLTSELIRHAVKRRGRGL